MMVQKNTKVFQHKLPEWLMKLQMRMNKSNKKSFLLGSVFQSRILYKKTKIKQFERHLGTTKNKIKFYKHIPRKIKKSNPPK